MRTPPINPQEPSPLCENNTSGLPENCTRAAQNENPRTMQIWHLGCEDCAQLLSDGCCLAIWILNVTGDIQMQSDRDGREGRTEAVGHDKYLVYPASIPDFCMLLHPLGGVTGAGAGLEEVFLSFLFCFCCYCSFIFAVEGILSRLIHTLEAARRRDFSPLEAHY
ncbi:hypothetical protein BDZ91DRAFT_723081 [Kalaharituber pfeilii]|nr:hypothetical protein BDZ91DRAFT_723081 [Kalaharituber pfeilii]